MTNSTDIRCIQQRRRPAGSWVLWRREWENRTPEILAMPTQSVGILADKRFIIAGV
jgi:hypothetical protein